MAWVTFQNTQSVDRTLHPTSVGARLRVKDAGEHARSLLLLHAAGQNRWLTAKWELYQLFLAAAFFCVMLFGSREDKFTLLGVLVLLGIVAMQRFLITPEWIALGGQLDFPMGDQTADQNRYWVTQTAHRAVEWTKNGLILLLAGQMIFSRKRSGRSRDSRGKLDRVDESYYRGVNR